MAAEEQRCAESVAVAAERNREDHEGEVKRMQALHSAVEVSREQVRTSLATDRLEA